MPVVSSEDGRWLLPGVGAPMLKPGGHGAIWKLMQDEGVFAWLAQQDRQAAIVRQIRHAPAPAHEVRLSPRVPCAGQPSLGPEPAHSQRTWRTCC